MAPVFIAVIGVLLAAICFFTYQFCHKYPVKSVKNGVKRVLSHSSNAEERDSHYEDEMNGGGGGNSTPRASFVGYMCKEKVDSPANMANSRSKSEDYKDVQRGLDKVNADLFVVGDVVSDHEYSSGGGASSSDVDALDDAKTTGMWSMRSILPRMKSLMEDKEVET